MVTRKVLKYGNKYIAVLYFFDKMFAPKGA